MMLGGVDLYNKEQKNTLEDKNIYIFMYKTYTKSTIVTIDPFFLQEQTFPVIRIMFLIGKQQKAVKTCFTMFTTVHRGRP